MALAEIGTVNGKERIEIRSDMREKEQIKLVPGTKWDPEARVWWTPLSWAACIQLRGVFGSDLQVGPALAAWGRTQRDTRVEPCMALRTAEDAPDVNRPELRPFQRAGVKMLVTAKQALLADEMGLGKTVQAIIALEETGDSAYPALIVSPNSMKFTWEKEFAKWAPGRRVVVLGHTKVEGKRPGTMKVGSKAEQVALVRDGKADVLVVNWEALRTMTRLQGYGKIKLSESEMTEKELNEVTWKSIVADEAHKAKEPKSQQTRALWYLGDKVNGGNRYMLTGTPVANSPADIWSLMRFVAPDDFPGKSKFLDRYAHTSWNGWGGLDVMGIKSETREELFKILDPRFIRRTKAAVLPQLPAKQYSVREVELGSKQRKAYDQIRTQMLAELEGGTLMVGNPLSQMTRLLQFACAHGEIDAEGNLHLGTKNADGTISPASESCTADAVVELAYEMGGEKAAIFSESVQLVEIAAAKLRKEGFRVGMVTGSVTGAERQSYVEQFNDGRIQFILITLGAGGEGLSLTGSSTAIFMQRSFSAVKNAQGEDRLHGIGRGKDGEALQIIDIVSQNTIQSRVFEIMQEKAEKLEEVVRDTETLKAWLSK